MKKIEVLTQEAKHMLHPIKQRPNIEPSKEFLDRLHEQIMNEQIKKNKPSILVKPFITAISVLVLVIIVFLTSQLEERLSTEVDENFEIEETSKLELIETYKYGEGDGEIGLYYNGMNNTLPVTVKSFDVYEGIIYLLDEARNQVVIINRDGATSAFPIQKKQNTIGTLEDILVTENNNIYIIQSLENLIYQYNIDGQLIRTHDLSHIELFFPDSLEFIVNIGVVVSQNQEKYASIETGKIISEDRLPYHFQRVNRKEQKLLLKNDGTHQELTLFSNLGIGDLSVQTVTVNQVIITQTISPPVYTPLAETHVLALNEQGSILGGVRIPVEKFIEKPPQIGKYIDTDNNKLYLLIPEQEHVALYEIQLGEQYDSFIEEQAESAKIGFDYKTFGKPFPELEEEIRKLFTAGKIEYGDVESLNGVAIDEHGTVIIDFKDFLAGSPASAQSMSLFEVLNAATFDNFPEIQRIYFQFDGSFSAWCYWLGSTEEPWHRP